MRVMFAKSSVRFFRGTLLGVLCLATFLAVSCSGAGPAQPNIIFVLTDLDFTSAQQMPQVELLAG